MDSVFAFLPTLKKLLALVVAVYFLLLVSSSTAGSAPSQALFSSGSFYNTEPIAAKVLDKRERNALASSKFDFEGVLPTICNDSSAELWIGTSINNISESLSNMEPRNESKNMPNTLNVERMPDHDAQWNVASVFAFIGKPVSRRNASCSIGH